MAHRYFDKYGLEHYHDLIQAGLIEYIEGTQTSATSAWTGVSTSPALFAGKLIIYHLPYNTSSATATLNLTHPDGTSVGAKQVQTEEGASPKPPAGTDILLVYDGAKWKTVAATPISDLTANRAMVSNPNGKAAASAVTATELGYLSGVTSGVQSQLDSKVPNALEEGTAADLGVGTVPDALNVIFDESKQMVGDIIRTMNDLGDNWLPVDGRIIEKEDYPDLYKLMAYNGFASVRSFTVGSTSASARLHFLKKINGYYIGMAYGYLFYRAENETSWTTRNLASTLLGSHYRIEHCDLIWDDVNNQYLIVANVEHTERGTTGRVRMFTMPTLAGNLTNIFEESTSGSGDTPVYLSKEGNYFFLHDYAYDSITAYNHTKKTYYTTDPNGTWSRLETNSSAGIFVPNLYFTGGIRLLNRHWFVGGVVRDTENSVYWPAVAISGIGEDLIDATWTIKTMGDPIAQPQYFSRYNAVNNILYMPKCGAYLFAAGEQEDADSLHFYSYDLNTFYSTTHAIGRSSDQQKYIDNTIYLTSGAYKDIPGNTGDPLKLSYTGGISVPKNLAEDGVYLTSSTTTITENSCVRALPDLGAENGMVYKIKAAGVSGTESIPEVILFGEEE